MSDFTAEELNKLEESIFDIRTKRSRIDRESRIDSILTKAEKKKLIKLNNAVPDIKEIEGKASMEFILEWVGREVCVGAGQVFCELDEDRLPAKVLKEKGKMQAGIDKYYDFVNEMAAKYNIDTDELGDWANLKTEY